MILQFTITALVIYGVKASTSTGMILEFIPIWTIKLLTKFLNDRYVHYLLKPLFDCTPCMASIYGTISYWCYYPGPSVDGWVVWVFALSGFNYILNKVINR